MARRVWGSAVRVPGPAFERGMSLVEIMIAMAVMSGLALAIFEITQMTTKSAKSVQLSTDWTSIVSGVQQVLGNEVACKAALAGQAFNPAGTLTLTQIAVGSGVIAKVGQPPQGMQVTGLAVTNTGASVANVTIGSATFRRYIARLAMTGRKTANAVGRSDYAHEYLFTVLTDASNVIQQCYGEFSSAQACADLGGSWDEAATPRCRYGPHGCEWVSGTGACNNSSPCHIFTSCPGGKKAINGGGKCPEGLSPSAVMTTSHVHPDSSNPAGWGITCERAAGVSGSILVDVLCCEY